jgi:hypothetical protein
MPAERPATEHGAAAALRRAFAGRDGLALVFALEPALVWRATPGRETFAWDFEGGAGSVRVAVKRLRGGEARDFWRERLAGAPWRSAARREADALTVLRARGGGELLVPAVLWCGEEPAARIGLGRRGGRSALVLEHVPHALTLRQALERDPAGGWREFGGALVALLAKLHDLGWAHRDLYLEHVAIREPDRRLVLLDLGRALEVRSSRLRPPRAWFEKDLAAVLHSAPALDPRELVGRYLEARELGEALDRWLDAVAARRRRLARHAPRHASSHASRPEPAA